MRISFQYDMASKIIILPIHIYCVTSVILMLAIRNDRGLTFDERLCGRLLIAITMDTHYSCKGSINLIITYCIMISTSTIQCHSMQPKSILLSINPQLVHPLLLLPSTKSQIDIQIKINVICMIFQWNSIASNK